MFWTETYRINSHDCDVGGTIKPSAVLRYMHETANLQHQSCGPTLEELRNNGKVFILSKINMSIYSVSKAFDNIKVISWGVESSGASFTRCARMYKDDVITAELIAVFALVDINTKRLNRVTDIQLGFDFEPDMLELDAPARFRIPEDVSLALKGEYTVYNSLCDQNDHMNNTNYIDMFCNFLPDIKTKRPITFSVNYQSEAVNGSVLKIYRGRDNDGAYYFRSVTQDGNVNAEARIMQE